MSSNGNGSMSPLSTLTGMRRPPAFARWLARREILRCGINSGSPDCFELVRGYVHAEAPAGNVRAFGRQHRVEHGVRRGESTSEAIQFVRCCDLIKIKQVTKPPDDSPVP